VNTLKVTEKETTVHSGCNFTSACYSPDGKYLATGEYNNTSGTGTVRIWDASNGQEYAKYNHGSGSYGVVYGLCFSSDSKTLVSSGSNDYSIIAYNVQTKT